MQRQIVFPQESYEWLLEERWSNPVNTVYSWNQINLNAHLILTHLVVSGHNVITPVIVKMRALWLVKDCVISRYNYLAWGKYSVGAEFQNGCLAFCQCYRGSIPELNQNYTRANLNSIKSSSPTPVTRKRSDFPWHHIFRDLLSAHWNPPSLQPIFCHPWKCEQAGLFSNFY